MIPSWKAFPDYLATEFPHLRNDIEDEALSWSPYPHYFLELYFLPELQRAVHASDAPAISHASSVLEAILAAEPDLVEAALHSVLEHLADCSTYESVLPHLGPEASDLVSRLRATSKL